MRGRSYHHGPISALTRPALGLGEVRAVCVRAELGETRFMLPGPANFGVLCIKKCHLKIRNVTENIKLWQNSKEAWVEGCVRIVWFFFFNFLFRCCQLDGDDPSPLLGMDSDNLKVSVTRDMGPQKDPATKTINGLENMKKSWYSWGSLSWRREDSRGALGCVKTADGGVKEDAVTSVLPSERARGNGHWNTWNST